jgi:isocitrate dehydrogenase
VTKVAGSVGLAGSANIGEECAIWEPGSARVQVKTNPSGLLEGAVMMLNHIGQVIAEKYKTLG